MTRPLGFVKQLDSSSKATEVERLQRATKEKLQRLQVDTQQASTESPEPPVAGTIALDSTPVAPESKAEETPVETPATPVAPSAASADDVKALMDMVKGLATQLNASQEASKAQTDALKVQLDEAAKKAEEAQAQAADAKKKADEAEAAKQKLIDTFQLDKFAGDSNPLTPGSKGTMFNTITAPGASDRPVGAVKEAIQILEAADSTIRASRRLGQSHKVFDTRELDKFVRDNKTKVLADLETWGKGMGLFRSRLSNGLTAKDSVTIASDIEGGFLQTLSSFMRMSHRPNFIFWQFATYEFNFAKGMGDTIQVARAPYLPAPASRDSRKLSSGGAYVPIDPARQNLGTSTRPIQVEEWGLGKDSNSPAVGIPTFVEAYSMISLQRILEQNLMQDYYNWQDLDIRFFWDRTSRVVYNNAGAVTATVGDLTSGSDGTATEQFFNNLFSYMQGERIPTLPNGNYIFVHNPTSRSQLLNSLGDKMQAPSSAALLDLTNILIPEYMGDRMEGVTGYLGDICGFSHFYTNAFGVGNAGSEGVQTETVNAVSTTTRTCYAAGAQTVGRGIGTPVEIRRDSNDGFGRLGSYIWYEESGTGSLDVDPTGSGDSSEQLRVIDVRFLDVAI